MAKEILDITIAKGYSYPIDLDFNAADGSNLETDYVCYFKNENIGTKTFSVVNNMLSSVMFSLTLTEEDTGKLVNNLEEYEIYVKDLTTQAYDQLLTGRIHLEGTIR